LWAGQGPVWSLGLRACMSTKGGTKGKGPRGRRLCHAAHIMRLVVWHKATDKQAGSGTWSEAALICGERAGCLELHGGRGL
jgi:hypothetical protein